MFVIKEPAFRSSEVCCGAHGVFSLPRGLFLGSMTPRVGVAVTASEG